MWMLTVLRIQDDGILTLREVVAEIPHDPAAFVVYALIAVSLYLVWRGSRRKKPASTSKV